MNELIETTAEPKSLKDQLKDVYFDNQLEYFEAMQEELKDVFFKVAAQGASKCGYNLGPIPQARLTMIEAWLDDEGIEVTALIKDLDGSVMIYFKLFEDMHHHKTTYKGF